MSRSLLDLLDPELAAQPLQLRVALVRCIFENQKPPGYSVWVVKMPDGATDKAVGQFAGWGSPGDTVTLRGRWVEHKTHGCQFEAAGIVPEAVSGDDIGAWLSTQPGIGPATAAAVVAALRGDLGDEVAVARAVAAVPEHRRQAVRDALSRAKHDAEHANAIGWLLSHGLGQARAETVWKAWGAASIGKVKANPWALADLHGFGFETADAVAQSLGVDPLAPERMRAAVVYGLQKAAENPGHVFLPAVEAATATARLLDGIAMPKDRRAAYGVPGTFTAHMAQAASDAGAAGLITLAGRRLYLPDLRNAEATTRGWFGAPQTTALCGSDRAAVLADRAPGTLDDPQRAAVATTLSHPASVLTGGPGTGKTTTTRAIIWTAQSLGVDQGDILLAAPTGRAALRLSEVTGLPARTIHRLLEFDPNAGEFRKGPGDPLDGRLLIVDEASMIDLSLMASLLRAVPHRMSVLFVGDADQLPPVGPGAPFHYLCRSGILPVARLERVHRTAEGGAIAEAARAINAGRLPTACPPAYVDIVFPRARYGATKAEREEAGRRTREAMAQRVVDEVRTLLEAGARADEVQVLVARNSGPLGTEALNVALRSVLNPHGRRGGACRAGGRELWAGDRVMHVRNDYEKDVMNGEIGRVVDAHESGLLVEYQDADGAFAIPYKHADLADLVLAYAATIHKAQGGEFRHVVFAAGWDAFTLLQRNLVYTAISRARDTVTVIREAGAMERAVANREAADRYQDLGPSAIR